MGELEVVDNRARNRFELHADGATAFILYSREGHCIRMVHTEVPDAMRGKGMGSKLVSGALELARKEKMSVVPLCPFVMDFLKRNPQYVDVVEPAYRRQVQESA